MARKKQQTITWTYNDPVRWCIYLPLGFSELKPETTSVIMDKNFGIVIIQLQTIFKPALQ